MRTSSLTGAICGAAAALLVLTGCGSQVAPAAGTATANGLVVTQTVNGHILRRSVSVMLPSTLQRTSPVQKLRIPELPDAKRTCRVFPACSVFITVAAESVIDRFEVTDKHAKFAGTIAKGLLNPQGLGAIGSALLVANTGDNNVLVYATKKTPKLIRTMTDATGYPVSVAGAADGNIYVTNIFDNSGNGEVLLYSPSNNGPGVHIGDPNLSEDYFVAVTSGDTTICVDGFNLSGLPEVDCSNNGGSTWGVVTTSIGFPGGLAFDVLGNLVIDDQLGAISDHGEGVSIPCPGSDCVNIAFGPADEHLYTTSGATYQLDWPSGSVDFLINGKDADGVQPGAVKSTISAQPIPGA